MKKYFLLVLLCFVPRFIFLIFYRHRILQDGNMLYWNIADNLLQKGNFGLGGHATTLYEPLYPIFLAVGRWMTHENLFFLIVLQIGVSCIGVVFLHRLAFQLSGNKLVAILAALFYSIYPYLIRQSVTIMEVSLLTTLLIAACYFYSKDPSVKNTIWCGITFALSILVRIVTAPIWLLSVFLLLRRKHYRAALILLLTTMVLVMTFSRIVYRGEGSLLPSRNGLNLFLANCEYTDQLIPKYSLDLLLPYWDQTLKKEKSDLVDFDEKWMNRISMRKAWEFIKRQPLRALKIRFLNAIYLYYPRIVPLNKGGELILSSHTRGVVEVINAVPRCLFEELSYTLPHGFLLITALWGVFLRRNKFKTDQILCAVVISFTAVYSFYWPATRVRSPMDFVFMFYSAYAVNYFLTTRWCSPWTSENDEKPVA